jgi:hypothetical protein
MVEFELWLEFEHWGASEQDDLENDFFNMQITFPDRRKYAFNIWTFKHFEQARCEASDKSKFSAGKYLLPPDLFVERLDRKLLEEICRELIKDGYMRDEWLVGDCI